MTEHKKPTKFTIPGDDATFQPKMWESLFTDCAFYFDRPTLEQETKMKQKLQAKYDPLFTEGWRPPL